MENNNEYFSVNNINENIPMEPSIPEMDDASEPIPMEPSIPEVDDESEPIPMEPSIPEVDDESEPTQVEPSIPVNDNINQNITQNPEPKKSNKGLIVILIILFIACLAVGGFLYFNNQKNEEKKSTSGQQSNNPVNNNENNNLTNEEIAKEGIENLIKFFNGNIDVELQDGTFNFLVKANDNNLSLNDFFTPDVQAKLMYSVYKIGSSGTEDADVYYSIEEEDYNRIKKYFTSVASFDDIEGTALYWFNDSSDNYSACLSFANDNIVNKGEYYQTNITVRKTNSCEYTIPENEKNDVYTGTLTVKVEDGHVVYYPLKFTNNNNNKSTGNESIDEFKRTVNGFVTTKKVENNEVVYFNVVNPDSLIKEFIKEGNGNTFFSENGFAIGCYKNGEIVRQNDSDANGYKTYTISGTDADLLINSNIAELVSANIEVKELSEGSGVDSYCYSYITNFSINK